MKESNENKSKTVILHDKCEEKGKAEVLYGKYPDFLEEQISDADLVEETNAYHYKRQGEYTLEDYYALPEEYRVELIDGYFYDMAAPECEHQDVAGEIHRQIANFIRENRGSCKVHIAPTDVQLNKDNRTMVQPDILICCQNQEYQDRCIYGAPDFVLEVLSKSTAKKDCTKKVTLYRNAGVREYWILDREKRGLTIYNFEQGALPKICGLNEPVPIGIYGAALKIDFTYVNEILDTYEEEVQNEK